MSIEAFKRAQQVFTTLQTDADFEHAGPDSRGIRIQADSLVERVILMATEYPIYVQQPLMYMVALIQEASEDYGAYLRIKGGPNAILMNVRGLVGPMKEEAVSVESMCEVMRRRSGIHVDISADGRSNIAAESNFMELDGQPIHRIINSSLQVLTEPQRDELAGRFIEIIAQEVAHSGEFLALRIPPRR